VGYSLSAFKEIFSNHQVCQVKSSGGNLSGGGGEGAGGPGQTHTSHLWSSLQHTVPLPIYSSSCLVIKFLYLGEYKVGTGAAVYAARKINYNYLITCCLYGAGRNNFDAGNIHYEGHLKGWALKSRLFFVKKALDPGSGSATLGINMAA
jgi:hypothetical protein